MKNILIISVLYFATRLFNLLILPIFTDESSYLYTSVLMKNNILSTWDLPLVMPVVKPPLLFWLTILFENLTNNVLLAGRFVSVMSGAVTLTGLFALTIKLFGKKIAIIASILYILSPFTLTYDRLALMDSLLSAFSVWILYVAFAYLNNKNIKLLLMLITLCFLSLLTKQSAKFFLLMLPFIPIIMRGKKEIKTFFVFAFVSLMAYLLYMQLFSTSKNFDFYNNFDKTYIRFSLQIIINNFKAVLSWTKSYFPLIIVFIPISIIYLLKKNLKYGLILTFWAFTPLVFTMAMGKYFFPRYLLPSIIFLFPMLAFLFRKYLLLMVIILIPSLVFDYYIIFNPPKASYHFNEKDQFISGWPAGYGVKEAFEKISSLDKNSTVLVEGDNGHLYSTFKLMGGKFNFKGFAQNTDEGEIIKQAEVAKADYVLINRNSDIIRDELQPVWSYKRPQNGSEIILYDFKNRN